MCGICGFILKSGNGNPQDRQVLQAMLKPLKVRGPDENGIYANPPVYLGMQRLAVIDVAHGQQPLIDPHSGVVIVYNGELYNYQQLRAQLTEAGHQFVTESDTEVILKAYLAWQHQCLDHFNGMFAFSLWDPRSKELFMARDHTGQKPFYYINTPALFAFASDLRSLLANPLIKAQLNPALISQYLQNRHVPEPQTLIKGIHSLPAAHSAVFDKRQQLQLKQYWQFRFQADNQWNSAEFNEHFSALWPKVIKRHLKSEVPLGGFLSGGIDSSLIAMQASQQMADFKTFSIGFSDKQFDETPYAAEVARQLGCQHTVIPFSEPFENLLDQWSRAYDQPLSDPAVFPTLVLARESRKQITVALAGDGADELFAGYQRYFSMMLSRRLYKLPAFTRNALSYLFSIQARLFSSHSAPRRWLAAAGRRLSLIQASPGQEYLSQFQLFKPTEISHLLSPSAETDTMASRQTIALDTHPSLLHGMLEHDINHWLPNQMLVKTDRATMAYSLELRLPFLDREILELASSLPATLLMHNSQSKVALRQFAAKHFPASVTQRRKHGFAVPVDHWIRQQSSHFAARYLQGCDDNRDLFDTRVLLEYWQQHIERRCNHGEKLLTLLLFFVWREQFRL